MASFNCAPIYCQLPSPLSQGPLHSIEITTTVLAVKTLYLLVDIHVRASGGTPLSQYFNWLKYSVLQRVWLWNLTKGFHYKVSELGDRGNQLSSQLKSSWFYLWGHIIYFLALKANTSFLSSTWSIGTNVVLGKCLWCHICSFSFSISVSHRLHLKWFQEIFFFQISVPSNWDT